MLLTLTMMTVPQTDCFSPFDMVVNYPQSTKPRPDATKLGVEPCTPALDCMLLWPAIFNCWCVRTNAQLDGIGP